MKFATEKRASCDRTVLEFSRFYKKFGERRRAVAAAVGRAVLVTGMVVGLSACDRLSSLAEGRGGGAQPKPVAVQRAADRVQKQNGTAYIPIDDTAFLIPEKTWLKGYARNATDGLVDSIAMHATVPDVQPWSQARNEEMYWPAGPGKKLEIYIKAGGSRAPDFHIPRSNRPAGQFIEEPSDQAAQGLRRFRQLWTFEATAAELEKYRKEWGEEKVNRLRAKAGTPDLSTVYYEFIENGRVKYFIYCSDSGRGLFEGCHLLIPWSPTLMVDVYFVRDHITDIVAMADQLSERLREFEASGLAFRAVQSSSDSTTTRP